MKCVYDLGGESAVWGHWPQVETLSLKILGRGQTSHVFPVCCKRRLKSYRMRYHPTYKKKKIKTSNISHRRTASTQTYSVVAISIGIYTSTFDWLIDVYLPFQAQHYAKLTQEMSSRRPWSQGSNSSGGSASNVTAVAEELEDGNVVVGKIQFNPQQLLGKGCDGTFVFKWVDRMCFHYYHRRFNVCSLRYVSQMRSLDNTSPTQPGLDHAVYPWH